MVNIGINNIQRRDSGFEKSDQFIPDRWNDNKDMGFNFIPFSAGPR